MSTTAGRWARQYAACVNCHTTASPHKGHGLCARCAQQDRRDAARSARAGWLMPEKYPDWRCPGCGTTIRPRHSAGLCVDCVRAAGRLATDPWEAA